MNLKQPLYASLAIVALAVPVTGGAIVAFSASPVLAKSSNGKGGSERGDRGKSDRRDSDRGKPDRGKSGQGGAGQGASGNGNGNGIGVSGSSGSGKPAKAAVESPPDPTASEDAALHPSALGSMNGAMNANINAVLAHIRNGNANGPVGALAGLAVADHNAAGAQEVLDSAAEFDALEAALEDAGYDSFEDYQAAVDDDGIVPISAIEDANAALGDAAGDEPPTEDEIAEAEAAVEALTEAEAGIFDAWNKSDTATEDQKAALLEALRARLETESDAIADAIGTSDDESAPDEDDEDGSEDDPEDPPEADVDPLDPEIQAMLDGLKF